MPPKKGAKGKKKAPRNSDDEHVTKSDVQYNPEIVNGLLYDLGTQVEAKAALLKKDIEFSATSIKQAFQIELIKLPSQVKKMSLRQFQQEFGESLEAVTLAAIEGINSSKSIKKNSLLMTATKASRNENTVFQTPSRSHGVSVAATPGTSRKAKENEMLYSANGSPLGEFSTVVKAPRPIGQSIVPPTPGVFVPLDSGDIVNLEEVADLPESMKQDALLKMQAMMANMQEMMTKLGKC